jgi:hypothetical protein
MYQFCRCFLGLLLTISMVGCGLISVADVAILALSAPVSIQKKSVKLSGYSLRSVPSEQETELLTEAIPPEDGKIHFTGRVEWTGLSSLKQSVLTVNQSVAAITDFNILFLWWSEASERYEVLIRLPFTEVYSIELWTPGFGTNIRFCHEKDEIPLGDQVLLIDRKTTLRVLTPGGGFVDAEKTREIFTLLDTQFIGESESQGQRNLCDEVPVSGEELPKGFGSCDPAAGDC